MTETEALKIAHSLAVERGWIWLEPATVRKRRRWFRCVGWTVHSNAQAFGCNVHVEIDDASGRVVTARPSRHGCVLAEVKAEFAAPA